MIVFLMKIFIVHGIIEKKEKVVSIWRKKISLYFYIMEQFILWRMKYTIGVAVKDGKIYKTGCNNEYKSLLKLTKKIY